MLEFCEKNWNVYITFHSVWASLENFFKFGKNMGSITMAIFYCKLLHLTSKLMSHPPYCFQKEDLLVTRVAWNHTSCKSTSQRKKSSKKQISRLLFLYLLLVFILVGKGMSHFTKSTQTLCQPLYHNIVALSVSTPILSNGQLLFLLSMSLWSIIVDKLKHHWFGCHSSTYFLTVSLNI